MPWEKGAPSPGLVEFLATNPPLRGKILVPGCGYGHDVRALSRRDNEVTGIDIAASAIRGADEFPKTGQEKYVLADLFDLPAEFGGEFDWVFEHTCFCAIEPAMRSRYVEAVARALKLGGRLLAVFYLDPGNDNAGPPYAVSREELRSLFGSAFAIEREWLPGKAYEGRQGREWMQLLKRRANPAS
jgi:SAM-dependent methyltransferase